MNLSWFVFSQKDSIRNFFLALLTLEVLKANMFHCACDRYPSFLKKDKTY